jgi:esterase/lipase superfamily enzyme
MQVEYYKTWSHHLQQEMEFKSYGHAGKPVLVFPAQGGRFFEFEDFGMIQAVEPLIDAGYYRFFTADSIDNQSWANFSVHPADRARRHEDYDRYIIHELVPHIHALTHWPGPLLATGVSMGGYHSANFFFRHPNIFDALISLSGLFQLSLFVGDYHDMNVYFNSPLEYLPNLNDPWYLDLYRRAQIVICAGQGAWEDAMLSDIGRLRSILAEKQIPAWIDLWGHDVNHDWPWWRRQLPYFLSALLAKTRPGL